MVWAKDADHHGEPTAQNNAATDIKKYCAEVS
jgi:hypothetical protein